MLARITINQRTVPFSSSVPARLSEHLLANGQCFYTEGSYGFLLVQWLQADPFAVLYATGTVTEELNLQLFLSGDGLICHFVEGQAVTLHSEGSGEAVLHSQSITLLSAHAWQGSLHFKEKGSYAFFSVVYPLSFVRRQLDFFPLLEELKRSLSRQVFFFRPNHVYPLQLSFSRLLYSLLHTPYVPLVKAFYHHLLTLLLGEILRSLQDESGQEPLFTLDDVDKIHFAKDWINEHLDTHFSIPQIARKAGLNEYKLKKGFKAVYGMGVYAYLLRQRLLIAKLALEQTRKPVKQIARQAGYANPNNFTAAFKRLFGTTPYQHRLRYRLR